MRCLFFWYGSYLINGIGNMITTSIMSQAHVDFPDATDLQIHTAYLNALTGTYEQITYYMYEELSGN